MQLNIDLAVYKNLYIFLIKPSNSIKKSILVFVLGSIVNIVDKIRYVCILTWNTFWRNK